MLKTLQTLGTGAMLGMAKAHGAPVSTEPAALPAKLGDGGTPAQTPDAIASSRGGDRRLLYDFGGLPPCNEVFPGGQTRGERFGQHDFYGRRTCVGPAIPGCGQPLFDGVPYAAQYPGRPCAPADVFVPLGK